MLIVQGNHGEFLPFRGGGGPGTCNAHPYIHGKGFSFHPVNGGVLLSNPHPKRKPSNRTNNTDQSLWKKNNSFPLRFVKANHDVTPSGKIQKIPSPFLWCSTSLYRAYAWGESRVCASHLWWPSSIMAGKIAGLIKGL